MGRKVFQRAVERLQALESDDPEVLQLVQALSSSVRAGNIIGSTGVAIGQNIRLVINQFNLPAETVAALLDARSALSGIDASRYPLGTIIQDKTEGFVGRDFVFRAIDTFLERSPNGYMIIEGDPGMGKTTLLAEYVRRTGCIAHFNTLSKNIVYPAQFIENVSAQIITEFGLPHAGVPAAALQDGALLARLLEEASQKLKKGERLVIAVDALDEVDINSSPVGRNILFLPEVLPKSVYFIMTRRGVRVPFWTESPQTTLDLLAYPADNRRDIENYLRQSVQRPKIQAWIKTQPGLTPAEYVSTLAERSDNNFMYLRYVLSDIEAGLYQDLKIRQLPHGLTGYYERHWERMGMTARPLPRLKIMIIYLLCVSPVPIPCSLLNQFLRSGGIQTDELAIQEVLDEWDQFLHEEPGVGGKHYSIYHSSFRDFLYRQDTVQKAGVTIRGLNAQMADSNVGPVKDTLEKL